MIEIEVFGIRDEEPIGACSCGGSCGSSSQKTMGEMFEELKRFILQSDLFEKVQVRFLDVLEDDLSSYDTAHMMFKTGYALPLVAIEGQVCFNGGISNSRIYEEIRNKVV
jgi:disulfide oxidoreductase YuzD